MTGAVRQLDVVRYKVAHHAVDAPASLEDVEDQAQRGAHPLVRVEDDLARGRRRKPRGRLKPSSPRSALFQRPSSSRARMMWSSASLIVPLSPSKRRSL